MCVCGGGLVATNFIGLVCSLWGPRSLYTKVLLSCAQNNPRSRCRGLPTPGGEQTNASSWRLPGRVWPGVFRRLRFTEPPGSPAHNTTRCALGSLGPGNQHRGCPRLLPPWEWPLGIQQPGNGFSGLGWRILREHREGAQLRRGCAGE